MWVASSISLVSGLSDTNDRVFAMNKNEIGIELDPIPNLSNSYQLCRHFLTFLLDDSYILLR